VRCGLVCCGVVCCAWLVGVVFVVLMVEVVVVMVAAATVMVVFGHPVTGYLEALLWRCRPGVKTTWG